jgi:hypothetical protein
MKRELAPYNKETDKQQFSSLPWSPFSTCTSAIAKVAADDADAGLKLIRGARNRV